MSDLRDYFTVQQLDAPALFAIASSVLPEGTSAPDDDAADAVARFEGHMQRIPADAKVRFCLVALVY